MTSTVPIPLRSTMTRSKKLAEATSTEYEKIRAKNMMRNNRIFQSLGIAALGMMVRNSNRMHQGSAITDGDSACAITQQGSRSEYSPDDEVIEEDEFDDIVVEKEDKVSKKARKLISKNTKTFHKPSEMAPGKTRVIAPASGGSKRVLPGLNSDEHESARVTRQKTKMSLTNHEESLVQMDVGSPANVDEGSIHVHVDVRSSVHEDERSPMHWGEVSLMQMGERSCVPPTLCTNQPTEVPQFSEQHPDQQRQMDVEATPTVDKCRKGKGLEKLTKELGSKIIIQVGEGKKRPDKPAQAAKLASQGGVAVRHHLPLLPHFKEYKANGHHIDNFIGKVAINFDMDTRSDAVKYACTDILKTVLKNRRHHLKKKYFDNVPANLMSVKSPEKNVTDAEWQRLVKMWSTPRHKEICQSKKENRSKVKFHQKTGSCPYISHVHALKEAHKGEELTAFNLFKECHNGKKTGYSEPVKKAIADIESAMEQEVPEGGEPKSLAAVVADILTKECPSSTFLKNVGLESSSKKKFNRSASALDAHVQELEYKLEKERQASELMQEELVEVKKKSEETEAARVAEYQLLLRKVEATDARAEASDARYARLMDLLEGKIV